MNRYAQIATVTLAAGAIAGGTIFLTAPVGASTICYDITVNSSLIDSRHAEDCDDVPVPLPGVSDDATAGVRPLVVVTASVSLGP